MRLSFDSSDDNFIIYHIQFVFDYTAEVGVPWPQDYMPFIMTHNVVYDISWDSHTFTHLCE